MAEIKIGGKIVKPHEKIKEEVKTSKKRKTKKSTKVDK